MSAITPKIERGETYADQGEKFVLGRREGGERMSLDLLMSNFQNSFMSNFSLNSSIDIHQPIFHKSTFE